LDIKKKTYKEENSLEIKRNAQRVNCAVYSQLKNVFYFCKKSHIISFKIADMRKYILSSYTRSFAQVLEVIILVPLCKYLKQLYYYIYLLY